VTPPLGHGPSLDMYAGPTVTAAAVIDTLLAEDILTEERLVSLLGKDRHDISLPKLEELLLRENVLSTNRLLLLKGMISGHQVLLDTTVAPRADFDARVSKNSGAIVLDLPQQTIAFVEDLPENLERVSRALGLAFAEYDVWLMTIQQFVELHKALYKGEKMNTRDVAPDVFAVLDEAVQRRASDIHLKVGRPPTLRIDGSLVELSYRPIDTDWMETEVRRIAGPERLERVQREHDADFAYQYGAARFRINLGQNRNGITVAARTLPTRVPTLEDLKLPNAIRRFVELERGLVLVTGPTGSGKSTTLAALLADIARNQGRHIITLEDPIEFALPTDGNSIIDQRELHQSFTSFPAGLRQALRQDPDVILVGELRDLETIRTAVSAAETGHLVFGTLHSHSAEATVGRIVSSFPAEEQDQARAQLAYILKGIVSQTLLPHSSGRGRVAAFEILVSTAAVSNNLKRLDGQTQLRQTMETGTKEGMQTMEMALASLVRRNLVRQEDAEFKAKDIEDFRRRLNAGELS
jgi:twitching motility protein PilT